MADLARLWRRTREWTQYLLELLYRVRAEKDAKAETVEYLQDACEHMDATVERLQSRVTELEGIVAELQGTIAAAQALQQLREVGANGNHRGRRALDIERENEIVCHCGHCSAVRGAIAAASESEIARR